MTDSRDSSDDWASGTASAGAGAEEAEPMRLREALEAKTREAEANQDRYLRTVAEFDNARKRASREREELIRYANETLHPRPPARARQPRPRPAGGARRARRPPSPPASS